MHGKTPIKLSQLFKERQWLLSRASLANSAYAYALLSEFAARIARADLRGAVALRSPSPESDVFWATLVALEGHQSQIEEHFTDEDLMDLADAIGYVTGEKEVTITFRIEDFAETFLAPLRAALEQAGVVMDAEPIAPPQHSASDTG